MGDRDLPGAMDQAPPTGSVVAIDWGTSHQEVWVSNRHNVGNWYTPDVPFPADGHPTWYDVRKRAEGRTLTLLVAADSDTYAAGFDAGVAKVGDAVTEVIDNMRIYANGCYPAPSGDTGKEASDGA